MSTAFLPPLVCVVEDDQDTRELYRLILEVSGYRVEEAPHVQAATALLKHVIPSVVLTDWLMPDGTGRQICEALQKSAATRHVPVVVVTGVSGLAPRVTPDGPHMTVLEKPVDPDQILTAVWKALIAGTEHGVRAAAERARIYAARLPRSAAQREIAARQAQHVLPGLLEDGLSRSAATISLILADDTARCVAAGGATRELTGYHPGELRALSVWDLTPPPHASSTAELWRQFVTQGRQEVAYILRHRAGHAVEAQYCAIANIAPGLHVSAITAVARMPTTLDEA